MKKLHVKTKTVVLQKLGAKINEYQSGHIFHNMQGDKEHVCEVACVWYLLYTLPLPGVKVAAGGKAVCLKKNIIYPNIDVHGINALTTIP